MKTNSPRGLVTEVVIAAAICSGVGLMLTGPLGRRADEAAAEIRGLARSAEDSADLTTQLPVIFEEADLARKDAARITELNRLALDEGAAFEAIMHLADARSLRVEQVAPSAVSKSNGASKSAPAPRAHDREISYSLSASGSFESITNFLAGMQRELGYCSLRSARIAPIMNDPTGAVQINLTTLHASFDPSPVKLSAETNQ